VNEQSRAVLLRSVRETMLRPLPLPPESAAGQHGKAYADAMRAVAHRRGVYEVFRKCLASDVWAVAIPKSWRYRDCEGQWAELLAMIDGEILGPEPTRD
jgi:hypothetical protein